MKKNMNNIDRSIRLIVAITIAVLFWQEIIQGALGYTLLVVAGVFALTSFVSFCPLYTLLGLKTSK